MEYYENQFDEAHDFGRTQHTDKTLIIASTVRSGSHMLGHILHQTGAFGFPLEYANRQNLQRWKQQLKLPDTDAVLRELMRRRTSPNGVFGIKLHYCHLAELGGFARLAGLFPDPHFVLLTRHDLLAQAVSLSRAKQTGAWIAKQQAHGELKYNGQQIDDGMRRIVFENSSWKYTLAATGARVLDLEFGEVKNHTADTVARIADFMQVVVPADAIPQQPVTQRQADADSVRWQTRFIEEFAPHQELLRYNRESVWRRLKKRFLS